MKIELTQSLGVGLLDSEEASVAQLFHENTKLTANGARRLSAAFSVSRSELFITSRPFRRIRNANSVDLKSDAVAECDANLAKTLAERRSARDLDGPISLSDLAGLLALSLGPTDIEPTAEEGISQVRRSWPSAGGLYPIDTYLLVQNITGVAPGLYSYNLLDDRLEQIPSRPVRAIIEEGFFWQSWVSDAACVVLMVGVMERTLSKYQARGYRLLLLDAGHAGQNVLLAAHGLGLGACAVGGFNDDSLAEDLQLDGCHEAVVHAIAVGTAKENSNV